MSEERPPRKWSLEEIDALLLDSGAVGAQESAREAETSDVRPLAVDPRPTRRGEIQHQIRERAVEHSEASGKTRVFGVLESDKYRDKFLNRPMQNLEKTAEHTPVSEAEISYEREGFIKRGGHFQNTVDLEPVPVLVSDEVLRAQERTQETDAPTGCPTKTIGLRKLATTNGNAHETVLPEEEDDSQLSFEGFGVSEPVEKVDEAAVEEELRGKRAGIVKNFSVTNEELHPQKEEEPSHREPVEYRNPNDKLKVEFLLKRKRNACITQLIVVAICFLLLLLLPVQSVIGISSDGAPLGSILTLVLLSIAGIAGRKPLKSGFASFRRLRFNRFSGCALALLAAVVQSAALLFADASVRAESLMVAPVALLPLLLNLLGMYLETVRQRENFRFVCGQTPVWSIEPIQKKETAFEVGRGLLLDEPQVLSSRLTQFPKRFLEYTEMFYPSDELNRKVLPLSFAASVLTGVISLLVTKNLFTAISAWAAAVAVSVPAFSFLADNIALDGVCKRLLRHGAMLCGWLAHKMVADANAVAADSSELFDAEGGNIFGIKTFSDIKVDEAILDTAALLIASGGPLGNLFNRVILGKTALLPPVDTLAYEDKLGLSAWIQNRRVLVGSRELLRNHNVEVPDKSYVDRFLHDGRYPLFLAVEGKLAAMFIVSYDIHESNARLVRRIERNSLSVLVRTDDANVTDEMISKKLSLPLSAVKVLSAVSGDILKGYRAEICTAAPAALLHDGKSSSFFEAIAVALSLDASKRIFFALQIGAIGISLAFVAAFALISGLSGLSGWQLVLSQGIFTGIGLAAVFRKK